MNLTGLGTAFGAAANAWRAQSAALNAEDENRRAQAKHDADMLRFQQQQDEYQRTLVERSAVDAVNQKYAPMLQAASGGDYRSVANALNADALAAGYTVEPGMGEDGRRYAVLKDINGGIANRYEMGNPAELHRALEDSYQRDLAAAKKNMGAYFAYRAGQENTQYTRGEAAKKYGLDARNVAVNERNADTNAANIASGIRLREEQINAAQMANAQTFTDMNDPEIQSVRKQNLTGRGQGRDGGDKPIDQFKAIEMQAALAAYYKDSPEYKDKFERLPPQLRLEVARYVMMGANPFAALNALQAPDLGGKKPGSDARQATDLEAAKPHRGFGSAIDSILDSAIDSIFDSELRKWFSDDAPENGLDVRQQAPDAPTPRGLKPRGTVDRAEADARLTQLEQRYSLPPGILDAVWLAESRRGQDLKSRAGAEGHFQFMPDTAKELGIKNVYDFTESSDGAARYLNALAERFQYDYAKALASYNWGIGRVQNAVKKYGEDWLRHAPKETREYVDKVLRGVKTGGAR
jgi:soluble lytic murein transglycosylase-like protein